MCFASLIILSFYDATMISYITSYHPQKLVSSAEELVRRPDVNLVVDEGLNIQIVLQVCLDPDSSVSSVIFGFCYLFYFISLYF